MPQRKHERSEILQRAAWDYYSGGYGAKSGYISNISMSGCLLKTFEIIEHRRWIRMVIHNESSNIGFSVVGRITRRENLIEVFGQHETTLYRYGVEFTRPEQMARQDLDLILALSSRNATVLSWRMRNMKSSFLPGSLA